MARGRVPGCRGIHDAVVAPRRDADDEPGQVQVKGIRPEVVQLEGARLGDGRIECGDGLARERRQECPEARRQPGLSGRHGSARRHHGPPARDLNVVASRPGRHGHVDRAGTGRSVGLSADPLGDRGLELATEAADGPCGAAAREIVRRTETDPSSATSTSSSSTGGRPPTRWRRIKVGLRGPCPVAQEGLHQLGEARRWRGWTGWSCSGVPVTARSGLPMIEVFVYSKMPTTPSRQSRKLETSSSRSTWATISADSSFPQAVCRQRRPPAFPACCSRSGSGWRTGPGSGRPCAAPRQSCGTRRGAPAA